MRDWNRFDDSSFGSNLDDDEHFQRHRRGEAQCDRCGEWWPADHMETDSGDCITCEDSDAAERYQQESDFRD